MSEAITIQNLDERTIAWLREQAQRTGTTVETIAQQLIHRAIAQEQSQARRQRHHDLDDLIGTWTEEEAVEFEQAAWDFGRIDEDLWA